MSATLQEACYENTTAVYMALELSNKQWKVLIGDGHHHRHKTVVAGDIAARIASRLCSSHRMLFSNPTFATQHLKRA